MRLFFGLSLPEEIRAAAAACAEESAGQIPGRYVSAENYHITLAFLGEVPEERVADAQRVLEGCVSFPAPRLTMNGLSYFGRAQNGILILSVKSEPVLKPLHDVLVSALHEEGLPADPGPFSPHITLARHARVGDWLPECAPRSFTAAHAHLYLSARGEDGVLRYTPLYTVPFAR